MAWTNSRSPSSLSSSSVRPAHTRMLSTVSRSKSSSVVTPRRPVRSSCPRSAGATRPDLRKCRANADREYPLISVPSKSRNAPTCGPSGPASTSASSCSSDHSWLGFDTDRLLPGRCIDLVDHDQPAHQVAQPRGKGPPAGGQLLAARADQVLVRGELQRVGEQLPRQRLRPVQPPLQQHLPPDAAALAQEPGF